MVENDKRNEKHKTVYSYTECRHTGQTSVESNDSNTSMLREERDRWEMKGEEVNGRDYQYPCAAPMHV
jgi:hypothetical protein